MKISYLENSAPSAFCVQEISCCVSTTNSTTIYHHYILLCIIMYLCVPYTQTVCTTMPVHVEAMYVLTVVVFILLSNNIVSSCYYDRLPYPGQLLED